jgi:hypothetical protein
VWTAFVKGVSSCTTPAALADQHASALLIDLSLGGRDLAEHRAGIVPVMLLLAATALALVQRAR